VRITDLVVLILHKDHRQEKKIPLFSSIPNHWPLKGKTQFCPNIIMVVKGYDRVFKMKNNLGARFIDSVG
jgi:hypothetical protein